MVCPILHIEAVEVGEREWLIKQTFTAAFEPFPEHCAFQMGIQQFSTMLFGYPPAEAVEEECACNGAAACVFRISWASVDEAEREAHFLQTRVYALESALEQFESTVADLVSGPDLQTVLTRTFDSAARAVQAPICVLSLERVPSTVQRVYFTGVSAAGAARIASSLELADLVDDNERLVVEVASTRGHYGRLAAVRPGGGFFPTELGRLRAYASFLAAALDADAVLAEARRQGDTARALLELSTSLAEVTTVAEMATKLVETVPAVMSCDRALVVLAVGAGTHAGIAATHGYPPDVERRLRELRIPIPEGVSGHSEFTRLADAQPGSLTATVMAQTGTKALTVIPIVVDGKWAGSIVASTVNDPRGLEPNADNEDRLRGLAAQASTAICNARLLDRVRHQALHDPLTGLPNRALILDRADQMLARARRHRQPSAAMFIDLDGFKDVNDTFGHAVGDELLRAVTARLQGILRPNDTVGRLGGDEFVVLVDGGSLDVGPELVAERILVVLREPFQIDGQLTGPLSVSASIGIATGDRPSAGDLLRDADIALYQAKLDGKDRFRVFEEQMQTVVQDRLLLQMDLHEALENQQFTLVYQPICSLTSGKVTGVEALIRWEHPTRGQIQPDDFIPLLEETGLILEVGRWVLNEACQQAARWRRRSHAVDIHVNVSGRQLQADTLLTDVTDALALSGLDPATLIVELTESTMMTDVKRTAQRLSAVRALGVRVAIDDFGTGYSSLAVLRDFPVDTLKIDRAFVSGLGHSLESAALMRTFVQLGKTLGLATLAEGIEDITQYEHLEGQQCESGQGFHIARPMPPEHVEAFLMARTAGDRHPAEAGSIGRQGSRATDH
jgi:diguanylate cyclase (GGDEF)-like protein